MDSARNSHFLTSKPGTAEVRNQRINLTSFIFKLYRILEGHEYGGQCVSVLDNSVIFSASLDRTLRTWDGEAGVEVDCVEDHTDYIQCLSVDNGWVATGGQGDKKIMVYRANFAGKLTR